MRYLRGGLLLAFILCGAVTAFSATQTIVVSKPWYQMDQDFFDQAVEPHIVQAKAQINGGRQGAEALMSALITDVRDGNVTRAFGDFPSLKVEAVDDKDFYCVFHILKWSPAGGGKQTVQAQRWYLYHQGELTEGSSETIPRIYGAGTITFIYIHLNNQTTYDPLYTFKLEKRTPAYISHLLGVTGLFGTTGSGSSAPQVTDTGAAKSTTWWGVKTLALDYKVADITVTPELTRADTSVESLGDAQKFDNEGKYLADVSVGVPIRRVSELKFDSVNNTVTAEKIEQTNLLAFLNVYPRPVDIRKNNVDLVPHFVGGVAIAKQPLHKIFVGTGFGPLVANFYIGALFVKQEQLNTLQPGDTSTPAQLGNDVKRKYKAQVAFGLNLPVGAVIEKLKGK